MKKELNRMIARIVSTGKSRVAFMEEKNMIDVTNPLWLAPIYRSANLQKSINYNALHELLTG